MWIGRAPPPEPPKRRRGGSRARVAGKVRCGYFRDVAALERGKVKDLVVGLTYIRQRNFSRAYEGEKGEPNEPNDMGAPGAASGAPRCARLLRRGARLDHRRAGAPQHAQWRLRWGMRWAFCRTRPEGS